ncbi:MAG TPA: VOC family protein [Rhodothermales bacterium]|nr:VOC family protein [Rhodothermales bacterium]
MLEIVLSVAVADVSRTVDFYRHVLGFDLLGATGKGGMTRARVRHGAVELLFRTARSEGMAEVVRKLDPEDRLVLYLKVDDIAALYQRVKGRVAIVRDLETTLFGMGEFAIEDLDGIVLWFSQAYSQPPAAKTLGASVSSMRGRDDHGAADEA